MPEVKLVNITKRYGRIVANDNVTFTLKNREYVSVIGPSGCGKTTLIKIISGIIKPDEGEVYIDGKLVSDLPIEDRGIGYVFQNIALFPHLNVWDNISYGPKVRGVPAEEIRPLAFEMLEMIKLNARSDSYPSELSGGTQQKTAVARALTSKADLLLLDEPLGALDVKVRAVLRHELRRIVKDLKLTALHVTHDQEEAMSISDRVIVMKRGRIVESGAPINLYTRPENLFTANFVGEANFITGKVIQSLDEGCLVEIGEDIQLVTNVKYQKLGADVVVAFRPEFISIGRSDGTNMLNGTVTDVIYSGNIGRIRVKLTTGASIVAKIALRFDQQMFSIGDDIILTLSPKSILIYPYPKEGLEKELALE